MEARGALAGLALFCLGAAFAFAGNYTWTTAGPVPGVVDQILVDPVDASVVYVIDGSLVGDLFRSVDQGGQWDYVAGVSKLLYVVPDPSRSGVLYALASALYAPGSPSVRQTSDGGRTWRVIAPALPRFAALALAPSDPRILYARPDQTTTVVRSSDGGETWALAATSLPVVFSTLAVDPSDSSIVYGAAPTEILKSVDSGETFSPASSGVPPSIVFVRIDPRDPATLYVATSTSGIFKSSDAGATWHPANSGIATHDIRDIALDPSDPSRLYAASYGDASAPGSGGIYVSVDGGSTWSPLDLGFGKPFRGSAVTVDPHDAKRVYAGVVTGLSRGRLLKSRDRGANWSDASVGLSGYSDFAAADPRASLPQTAYAISDSEAYRTDSGGSNWSLFASIPYHLRSFLMDPSTPSTWYGQYTGTTAGVAKSLDGGLHWTDASNGLSTSFVYDLAIGRSDPTTLLASTTDGIFRTIDGGGNWSKVLARAGYAAAVDPADPQILYAGLTNQAGKSGFLRSDDGGATWSAPAGLSSPSLPAYDIRVDPSRPDYVYAKVGERLMRSTDRGLHFAEAMQGIGIGTGSYVSAFAPAIDPSRPENLYTEAFGGSEGYGIFRSTDSAQTWSLLAVYLPFDLAGISVSSTGRTLYASTPTGIFQLERSFHDIPDTAAIWRFVDAAALNGLTAGCGGGNFCPEALLTRAQAAVLLLRAARGPWYTVSYPSGLFADVPLTAFAASWIESLFVEGITGGCGGGNFCPDAPLTRAEMAIFLLRAKHGSAYVPPPATGTVFLDVPAGAFGAAWIEQLSHEGWTAGCGGGNFCPAAGTTRGQAVTLLVSAFGLK